MMVQIDTNTERADRDLIAAVHSTLAALALPSDAPQMQRYMKSEMAYLGVKTPVVRSAIRKLAYPMPAQVLLATVAELWRTAEFREQRYAAIELLDSRYARAAFADGSLGEAGVLNLIEEMIRTGAWWDYVDAISHRLGDLLRLTPEPIRPAVLRWARDSDRWIRRASIICQLGFRSATDLELLAACIEPNCEDKDFFIRKGIGWALRELAKTDPDWVRAFLASHPLSPLSVREACKHIGTS